MSRRRHNIILPEMARNQGGQLASEDKRSFSGQVAWLIEEEWKRRGKPSAMPTEQPQDQQQNEEAA